MASVKQDPRSNTAEDFWAKVEKSADCWMWRGCGRRYGIFPLGGKSVSAHRFSYELQHGHIPAGLCVCHSCDNPLCVRPDHLFLGTHASNIADKVAKGRQAKGAKLSAIHRGEDGSRAKLIDEDIERIREAALFGGSRADMASTYDVHYTTIGNVVRRSAWNHL